MWHVYVDACLPCVVPCSLAFQAQPCLGKASGGLAELLAVSICLQAGLIISARRAEHASEPSAQRRDLCVPQVYWWHEKYKPRKPKYFNRVHTGYEWNKYNQTHYDHDNPPPKTVQVCCFVPPVRAGLQPSGQRRAGSCRAPAVRTALGRTSGAGMPAVISQPGCHAPLLIFVSFSCAEGSNECRCFSLPNSGTL